MLNDGENPSLYFHKKDVLLCMLPLFHIYSLNSVLLCGLHACSAIVTMKNYVFVKSMELAEKYRVTMAPFVPPIVVEIAKSEAVDSYDLSSVRMVMPGAAPMGRNCRKHLRLSFLTLNLDGYVDGVHDNNYVVSFRLGTKAIGEDIEGQ